MTLGETTVVPADERALAFGYGQRRSWVFWAWWYGMVLAITGLADAALSLLVGQDPSRGIWMILLGAAVSVLGWLVTLGLRFSKKPPKPASDVPRVEQALRINPWVVKGQVGVAVLVGVALVFLTPNGRSPEVLPYVSFVVVAILSLAAGTARSAWLMRHSAELYQDWLERRQGVSGR